MEIKIPPNPHGHQCKDCVHWLASERKAMVITGTEHLVAVSDLIKAGQPIPDSLPRGTFAACTRFAVWQNVVDVHWCGEWQYRLRGVENLIA